MHYPPPSLRVFEAIKEKRRYVYSSEITPGKLSISTMQVETCWQCQVQDTIRSWHWN